MIQSVIKVIGLCVSITLLAGCAPKYVANAPSATQYKIVDSAYADTTKFIKQLLTPYKLGVDTMMSVVIGTTDEPLTKASPECLLGNLITDALLQESKLISGRVAAAVMNYGGIRLDYVPPGNITLGKIYEIMPFDNTVTIVEVPGKILQQWCNHMAMRKGWPVAGMSFQIKDKKAINVLIDGNPINENIIYSIVTNDYVANGGDQCDFLESLKKTRTNAFIRDVLIKYIRLFTAQGKPVHPQILNRVTYAD